MPHPRGAAVQSRVRIGESPPIGSPCKTELAPPIMRSVLRCFQRPCHGNPLRASERLQAQNQQLQGQVAGLQREARFVEAGDLLFPEGGYPLSSAGKAELSSNIVPKLT
jgi:hypothetical protein